LTSKGVKALAATFQIDMLWKLILSICLGGAIGLEREFHRQDAGFRTHILVCLGSTVMMIGCQQIVRAFSGLSGSDVVHIDPGRIAAGIVTGIGFLGGGAIFRSTEVVRGLTTAACIWLVAGLGIVIGEGFYVLAIMTTVLAVFVLLILRRLERSFKPSRQTPLVLAFKRGEGSMTPVKGLLQARNAEVTVSRIQEDLESDERIVELEVGFRHRVDGEELVGALAELPGIRRASWG